MGGMLLFASIGRSVSPDLLRRVVIIGSPARIRPPLAMLARVAAVVPQWIVPTLRLRIVSRFLAFGADLVHTPIHRWVYNPSNVDRGIAAHSLVNGFVNIPRGLAVELVQWSSVDEVVRYDGEPVTQALRTVSVPALFVAGTGDRLAPVESVKIAFDAWGADVGEPLKRFLVVGVEHGAAADYGHGDLAIGRFAETDVFEPVSAFLAEEEPLARAQGSDC